MASLADLFNPTFLIFLGILVLLAALLVIYFESNMRDQNHKIASMLSLVSTLAEDINGIKMGFNQLAVTRMNGSGPENLAKPLENSNILFSSNEENTLIEVSDNDCQEEEDGEFEDSEFEESDFEESDSDDEDKDEEDDNDVKVLKIDINSQNYLSGINTLDIDELEENDDLVEELSETQSLTSLVSNSKKELLTQEKQLESTNISSKDLKTISVNLENQIQDSIEYKKMTLPKLRSIVSEKGLASDTSKLKKNELLKLLGIE